MHCFYNVRHVKGPCDACTGCVKQGMVRLVKNGTCVTDTPEAFYAEAKKTLNNREFKAWQMCAFQTNISLYK